MHTTRQGYPHKQGNKTRLVTLNITEELGHLPLRTNPQLVGSVGNESFVVTMNQGSRSRSTFERRFSFPPFLPSRRKERSCSPDTDDSSLINLQRLDQRINTLNIQVIRRLPRPKKDPTNQLPSLSTHPKPKTRQPTSSSNRT
jgi:hypothetical protein